MIEDLTPLISQVGFPIVISLYVLMRLEKTVQRNTEVILKLTNSITELVKNDRRRTK